LNDTFAIGDYEENTAEFNVVKSIDVQADVDREFALQEREVFRFDRVMFGSDWPVCLFGIEYGQWVAWVEKATSGATEVLRRSLFYETAARFYRL
jgi:predicted TIM-barrel fold metal-dependent hydrolase